MRTNLRDMAGWAPFSAALSLAGYGVALQFWPAAAGRFFAALFGLDPYSLLPLHGWGAVLPGVALWLAGCYVAAAVGWWLRRGYQLRGGLPLRTQALRIAGVLQRTHTLEKPHG
ncbi:MAG TPA: hypothetical protein VKB51_00855 [bacterium]|nr:hypothetical protein [bacterium]